MEKEINNKIDLKITKKEYMDFIESEDLDIKFNIKNTLIKHIIVEKRPFDNLELRVVLKRENKEVLKHKINSYSDLNYPYEFNILNRKYIFVNNPNLKDYLMGNYSLNKLNKKNFEILLTNYDYSDIEAFVVSLLAISLNYKNHHIYSNPYLKSFILKNIEKFKDSFITSEKVHECLQDLITETIKLIKGGKDHDKNFSFKIKLASMISNNL